MFDGIFFVVFGIYAILVGLDKVPVSKNPQKNKEWLSKFGKFFLIIGPILIIIGALRLLMEFL